MAISHNHCGHRERIKQKFVEKGLDSFSPHEILEILLYYSIPRKNTNDIAHNLINEFGSLSSVFEAPMEELQKINGISENTAIFLKLIPEVCRHYYSDKCNGHDEIITLDVAGEILLRKFIGRVDEAVVLMLLDNKGKLLFCDVVSEGTVNCSQVYIRQIVALALKHNATVAILAHNHPSGIALPSKNDIDTTIAVGNALKLVDVKLIDHLIIADGDYVSLAADKLDDRMFS